MTVGPSSLAQVLQVLSDAGWPVEPGPGLRLEPNRPGPAAAVGTDAAELLALLLEVLEQLDPDSLAYVAGAREARAALDGLLPHDVRAALASRAEPLVRRVREQSRRGRPPRHS